KSSARTPWSTPMSRIRSGCCARATKGHVVAPTKSVMNSRRRIVTPDGRTTHRTELHQRKRVKLPLSASRCPLWAKSEQPQRSKSSLVDHLVGGGKERCRYGELEHACGFGVDDEFEL